MKNMLKSLMHSSKGIIGLFLVLIIVLAAVLAPVICKIDPNEKEIIARLKEPMTQTDSGTHFFGTDSLGRDVFSRTLYAARMSLAVSLTASLISLVIGCTVGLCSGYFGGKVDAVLSRISEIQLAFPFILLALTVLAVLGNGMVQLICVMGLGSWVSYARIAREEAMTIRKLEYVDAAKVMGLSSFRILLRHLLPNIVSPIIVVTTFNIASNVLTEASLSFLGRGVDVSMPSWGSMLADSKSYVISGEAWWCYVIPGVATMITVLGINLLGDWLRDFLNPRLKTY